MKKTLLCLALLVGICFAQTVPQPKTINDRATLNNYVIAQGAPYTYFDTVNLSSTDWTCPNNVWVYGIYVNKCLTIKMALRNSGARSITIDSLCGLPLDVVTIYKTGTDMAGYSGGKIIVIGHKLHPGCDTCQAYK